MRWTVGQRPFGMLRAARVGISANKSAVVWSANDWITGYMVHVHYVRRKCSRAFLRIPNPGVEGSRQRRVYPGRAGGRDNAYIKPSTR